LPKKYIFVNQSGSADLFLEINVTRMKNHLPLGGCRKKVRKGTKVSEKIGIFPKQADQAVISMEKDRFVLDLLTSFVRIETVHP
jgi:hypothetical protein